MKIIKTIPGERFNTTIFYWNQKYLIKFEQEDMEQTYKIKELDTAGEEEITGLINNEAFMEKVETRFEQMREDFMEAMEG